MWLCILHLLLLLLLLLRCLWHAYALVARRCGKCNQFGLEGECCGMRYHIVLRAKRIPLEVSE